MPNLFDIQYFRKKQGMVKLRWKQKALHTSPFTGTSYTYHPKSNGKIIHILRKVSTNLQHCVKLFFGPQSYKTHHANFWNKDVKLLSLLERSTDPGQSNPSLPQESLQTTFLLQKFINPFLIHQNGQSPRWRCHVGTHRSSGRSTSDIVSLGEVVHPILVQTYANCWVESVLKLLLLIFKGKASPRYIMSDHLKQSCLWVYTVRLSADQYMSWDFGFWSNLAFSNVLSFTAICEMSALLFFGTVGLHPHVCYVGDELLVIETQAAAR